ncbi:chorismate mutase [Nitrosomonas cryotolerans]|uniref:Bifunctional chorismate mutase/prephenate dehydratase n=1 Tax=Nitrosomonas cryotolerans ATCC 49181 TaxID=1131553 RepID=A0A1N6HI55_9PROT|nr:prephenate dehydratase [Nitrosomonas cryotolerans]SFP65458.1 chorismate mutase [Nitrosomonas cryotolerans]SIO19423.1 chorismate mutase [Nitrosomonas cryotolerans ATCC 49181]
MTEELQHLRDKIDTIDNELLKLVNERAKLAQAIGQKKKSGIIYRPDREAQILERLKEHNLGPVANERIIQLFTEIMSLCRAMEEPITVAYLGPRGTFSEEAALKRFGNAITTAACDSIDEVFRKVESGAAGYGVVPIENSTEGAIGRTMDLLLQTPLIVCGEIQLPIHQYLMAQHTELSQINKIYSHPQSFSQCHEWLHRNLPHLLDTARINAPSNADAARLAAADKNAAAIASKRAADVFGLAICAENIEDDPKNTTRFLVIGTQNIAASGKDKTSLVISTNNRPGAIHELLAPLAQYGVGMSRLESRPSRTGLWEYVFFIDIEGHQENQNVVTALQELRKKATFLKIFGSYPVA